MQTGEVQISPNYRYQNDEETTQIRYYEFNQSFNVIIEDASKYETILYGLLGMGINKIENISMYSTDMLKYRNQARLNAIQAAKDKAKLLTEAVGMKLGKVISISEGSDHSYYGGYRNSMMSNVAQNMVQSQDIRSSSEEGVSLGMVPVKASVSMVYEVVQ